MTTRQTIDPITSHGVPPLPTGYGGDLGAPDVVIPPCGVEDVDTALFDLFSKEIPVFYKRPRTSDVARVPVIFASGEKWSVLKQGRALRDDNNTLILPLITIMRTETSQNSSDDVAGRGINQQTGELIVRRKLDPTDRQYQALMNRIYLKSSRDVALTPDEVTDPTALTTDRRIGRSSSQADRDAGALLVNDRTMNVYETIVVPTPQFYTAKYDVVVWTQYMQHANPIMEGILGSMMPQGRCWRITSPKSKYWFVAYLEDGGPEMETNFDDMSQDERFIKHKFSIRVPAYMFATQTPGAPIPVKRYVSCPTVTFQIEDPTDVYSDARDDNEYVLGSDDPTLPMDDLPNNRVDQRTPGWRPGKIESQSDVDDPATTTLSRGRAPVRRVRRNAQGETVYSGTSFEGLEIEFEK